jgi:hypothetical protein
MVLLVVLAVEQEIVMPLLVERELLIKDTLAVTTQPMIPKVVLVVAVLEV